MGFLTLITLSLHNVWISLGENCCWPSIRFISLVTGTLEICSFIGDMILLQQKVSSMLKSLIIVNKFQ